jgi:hypothetical protein
MFDYEYKTIDKIRIMSWKQMTTLDWMQVFMNRAEGQKLTGLILQGLNIL